jgi:hypothetical protein
MFCAATIGNVLMYALALTMSVGGDWQITYWSNSTMTYIPPRDLANGIPVNPDKRVTITLNNLPANLVPSGYFIYLPDTMPTFTASFPVTQSGSVWTLPWGPAPDGPSGLTTDPINGQTIRIELFNTSDFTVADQDFLPINVNPDLTFFPPTGSNPMLSARTAAIGPFGTPRHTVLRPAFRHRCNLFGRRNCLCMPEFGAESLCLPVGAIPSATPSGLPPATAPKALAPTNAMDPPMKEWPNLASRPLEITFDMPKPAGKRYVGFLAYSNEHGKIQPDDKGRIRTIPCKQIDATHIDGSNRQKKITFEYPKMLGGVQFPPAEADKYYCAVIRATDDHNSSKSLDYIIKIKP